MERSARLPIWAGRPVWADNALLATGLAAFGVSAPFGALDNQPTSRPPGCSDAAINDTKRAPISEPTNPKVWRRQFRS
jgi:hypothetical protein